MNFSVSQQSRLPDFIIGGAPKCGTTSLHFILAQHPDVGIPDDEVHFFDADDPIGHPDFLFGRPDGLDWYDPRPENKVAMDWYRARFAGFADRRLIGEDSTIYLQSEVAPARIQALLPEVRLVFMLRDPVKRAYSQYWHLVTRGRATCSFETALSRHPSIILGSTYAPHLQRYLDRFGPDQVRIGLFEDFLQDGQGFVDGMTDFIGLSRRPLEDGKSWFNRTWYPTRPGLQLALNRVSGRIVAGQYRNHFGDRADRAEHRRSRFHHRWFRHVHPMFLKAERPPAMRPDTQAYLRQHLSARNAGLSALLGRDLAAVWPGFTA
ncbi:sulfotransferase family protein [Marinibacterium sp. SX1]|uniref:sulfotransferase family protein n=1 Tax=Marinibacterium sp. SX1 TaxID=3388424 RepID=UPI003D1684AD